MTDAKRACAAGEPAQRSVDSVSTGSVSNG
jgi:hypothetical protein